MFASKFSVNNCTVVFTEQKFLHYIALFAKASIFSKYPKINYNEQGAKMEPPHIRHILGNNRRVPHADGKIFSP